MISEFENQLYGGFRVGAFHASPRPDGSGITFECPKCAASRLEVAEGIVSCPACGWGATGSAWEIAQTAAKDGRVK